jgi:hypothetical protein
MEIVVTADVDSQLQTSPARDDRVQLGEESGVHVVLVGVVAEELWGGPQ